MARTDFVISAFERLAIVPEAELDALREAVEVLEGIDKTALIDSLRREIKQLTADRDHWSRQAWKQLYAGIELQRSALEAVEVLEDQVEQEREHGRAFVHGVRETWRSLWQQQRDESERLAAQVAELREQNAKLGRKLSQVNDMYEECDTSLDAARRVNAGKIRYSVDIADRAVVDSVTRKRALFMSVEGAEKAARMLNAGGRPNGYFWRDF